MTRPIPETLFLLVASIFLMSSAGSNPIEQHLPFDDQPQGDGTLDAGLLVAPRKLVFSGLPGQVVDMHLTIDNRESEPFNFVWGLFSPSVPGALQLEERAVASPLWEQGQATTQGIASGFSLKSASGSYAADDFVLSAPAEVSSISALGFNNFGALVDQVEEISWYVFADSGGIPAGDPENNPEVALFQWTANPGDPGVDLSSDNIVLDLVAATGSSVSLNPGGYWLSIVPVFDFEIESGAMRWNWFTGQPAQAYSAKMLSPDLFEVAGWTDIPDVVSDIPAFSGLAFSVHGASEGAVGGSCNTQLPDWISVSTPGTTIAPESSIAATISVDLSIAPVGSQGVALCVGSASGDPFPVLVPVDFDLLSDGIFADSFFGFNLQQQD